MFLFYIILNISFIGIFHQNSPKIQKNYTSRFFSRFYKINLPLFRDNSRQNQSKLPLFDFQRLATLTVQYARQDRRPFGRGATRGFRPRNKPACYLCGDLSHFQRYCPQQYCQLCGKQGHSRRDCRAKKQVLTANTPGWPNHSGAVIAITLGGRRQLALLDSGANPSIVDAKSLQVIGVTYARDDSHVYGVGDTQVPTLGEVIIPIDIGDGREFQHSFLVLDSRQPTIILGRDFLKRFKSTEFDWENNSVRLGDNG